MEANHYFIIFSVIALIIQYHLLEYYKYHFMNIIAFERRLTLFKLSLTYSQIQKLGKIPRILKGRPSCTWDANRSILIDL